MIFIFGTFSFYLGVLGIICYNPIMDCLKRGRNKSDALLKPRRKQYAPIQ